MNNIDEILEDGRKIYLLMENSLYFAELIMNERKYIEILPKEKEGYRMTLKNNWKRFQEFSEKYPNSEFVKETVERILNSAKEDLPEEVYKEIYENEQH
ncbi:MAG: hypothetical protein WC812_02920 [Candidatus Pacearchaeota archaeon]|jgi:hypothetical protein